MKYFSIKLIMMALIDNFIISTKLLSTPRKIKGHEIRATQNIKLIIVLIKWLLSNIRYIYIYLYFFLIYLF